MLIFIDESGDPGFNFAKGASEYFALAAVIFKYPEDAEEASTVMKKLRKSLNKGKSYEFKFNKLRHLERLLFLQAIAEVNFEIVSIVYNKRKLAPIYSQLRSKFYTYAISQLLLSFANQLSNARVVIDGSKEKDYTKYFSATIRQTLESNTTSRLVQRVKFADSRNNDLIQLADTVVGSIRYYYSHQKNTYFKLVEGKVLKISEL